MSEKETQKTSPEASDETKKTESKEELVIPKSRFDEVNNKAKELEAKLAEIERLKEEDAKKKLEDEGKLKELLDITKAENDKLKIDGLRRDLIQEAITNKKLHPQLSKMVQGSNEVEIKKSLEEAIKFNQEVMDKMKEDKTASDTSGRGSATKTSPMSAEEWMRMYKDDPDKADDYLRKITEASNK